MYLKTLCLLFDIKKYVENYIKRKLPVWCKA